MTDPFDQLFNSFFCKNNLYSFSRSNDESYGKIKLVIYGRKIMENKTIIYPRNLSSLSCLY